MIHRRPQQTERRVDAVSERDGVTGLAVVGVEHRQIELLEVEQFRRRSRLFGGSECALDADSGVTLLPETADDADDAWFGRGRPMQWGRYTGGGLSPLVSVPLLDYHDSKVAMARRCS